MIHNISRYFTWSLVLAIQFAFMAKLKASHNTDQEYNSNDKISYSVSMPIIPLHPTPPDEAALQQQVSVFSSISILPEDTLSLIYNDLREKVDKDNFSLVCKPWSTIANGKPENVIKVTLSAIGEANLTSVLKMFPNLIEYTRIYHFPLGQRFKEIVEASEKIDPSTSTVFHDGLEFSFRYLASKQVMDLARIEVIFKCINGERTSQFDNITAYYMRDYPAQDDILALSFPVNYMKSEDCINQQFIVNISSNAKMVEYSPLAYSPVAYYVNNDPDLISFSITTFVKKDFDSIKDPTK